MAENEDDNVVQIRSKEQLTSYALERAAALSAPIAIHIGPKTEDVENLDLDTLIAWQRSWAEIASASALARIADKMEALTPVAEKKVLPITGRLRSN